MTRTYQQWLDLSLDNKISIILFSLAFFGIGIVIPILALNANAMMKAERQHQLEMKKIELQIEQVRHGNRQ